MDAADASADAVSGQPVIVKADEVDELGANIGTTSSDVAGAAVSDDNDLEITEGKPASLREDVARAMPMKSLPLPARPQLRRDQSQPPPAQQLPPVPQQAQQAQQAQQEQPGNPTDSLSLMQLKRIVTDMPKYEPTPYAFVYEDTAPFPEELEEWFSYGAEEQEGLVRAQTTFEARWQEFNADIESPNENASSWIRAEESRRKKFVGKQVADLEHPDIFRRGQSLESILYIVLGAWRETAGRKIDDQDDEEPLIEEGESKETKADEAYATTGLQKKWMIIGSELVYGNMGVQPIFDVMRGACLRGWDPELSPVDREQQDQSIKAAESRELRNALTVMYLLVEAGRINAEVHEDTNLKDEIAALEPKYLIFLLKLVAKLRWNDSTDLPVTKILFLFWKSILLLFGGIKAVDDVKAATHSKPEALSDDQGHPLITASPLDYHLFRQEVTSKYPAYDPPPPLLPFEPENNSILPPLSASSSRSNSSVGLSSRGWPSSLNGTGGSIVHQPVHIATPAPSPPPSPAGPGGKTGKKQNYQTNQNFPFLYPPLDGSSNSVGGKGNAVLQDLVGKKWEGSDIPASILEAGQLFASRMRTTRAMRQLWKERERFIRFERGWGEAGSAESEDDDLRDASEIDASAQDDETSDRERVDQDIHQKLAAVDDFYREALPHLQSVVIVLLKLILANVTALVTQPNGSMGTNGYGPGFPMQDPTAAASQPRAGANVNRRQMNGTENGQEKAAQQDAQKMIDELDSVRSQEITAKAVSGLLILLLKWFKISHVLKFEYMTQLLLDSNYLPLILKLFAHQELERVVDSKTDRDDLGFFAFCQAHSDNQPLDVDSSDEEDDDACPPPVVQLRRKQAPSPSAEEAPPPAPGPPEVDELGYPVSDLPAEPITNYSWRNFFSTINYLRIMQKICKNKAHRNLLLVQYKSSTILRKALKVPQPTLRLYTLKLFKNQVPYCGRKWRQSNMRVITAIYLHCHPELRDDWLAGSDIDAEVEDALPHEQALRALTHWFNLKRYPEQMGAEKGVLDSERDFFARELENMEWEDDGLGTGYRGDPGLVEGWDGPLQMEGW
ncbi:MAG: hypothetical protein M1819_006839 [Sarea resinae]|nr:MAG: hypothetical protein M1819_006839 [Sarea resinae]